MACTAFTTERYVVINADDLGICRGVNTAVAEAHRYGVLTSASLMANGGAFDHALEHTIAPNPELGIGLHLTLTSGTSVSPPAGLPDLVDSAGRFRHGFVSLFRAMWKRPSTLLRQVETELTAQFEKVRDAGVEIDHVDGHRYVHMIPGVYEIVASLAVLHDCQWLRHPYEPLSPLCCWLRPKQASIRLRNLPKRAVLESLCARQRHLPSPLQRTSSFHGVLDSGAVTTAVLRDLLAAAVLGVTEIVTHPGTPTAFKEEVWPDSDAGFLRSPSRQIELRALIDGAIVLPTDNCKTRLVSFRTLSAKPANRFHDRVLAQ